MDNPLFVNVTDPRALIQGKDKELWLPLSESPHLSPRTEAINLAGVYFDVVGYSDVREALLLRPIEIDGSADNLEAEVEAYERDQ